ncbi:MAG: PEP/pyruvate-binding domain-containing protein [Desulfobacterales bacterium]|nr:PEP/pyruvate-binding domain-containing protein [Desulfobacterales bacterium]
MMEDIKPPDESEPAVQKTNRAVARIRDGLLFFLEAIGLRRSVNVDSAAQVARLKSYHTEFRKLISANNSFLETTADLEHKILSSGHIDPSFTKRKVMRAIADIYAMVESLNVISRDRYPDLKKPLERITAELKLLIEESDPQIPFTIVLEMPAILRSHADLAGGKMANLGEIKNVLRLPSPDGFVVTTEGFRMLMEESGIRSWVQDRHMELLSESGDAAKISSALRERIEEAEVPLPLREAIFELYDRLSRRTESSPFMAVRSSALGEDSDFSYAGQFLSVLNAGREDLPRAYLRVVASLYSPEAIQYQLLHGILSESAEMAVGFIAMVDTVTSGVAFSKDPNQPDSGQILIQSVLGLGVALVDGKTSPESIFVPRDNTAQNIVRIPSQQKSRFVPFPGAGLKEVPIAPEEIGQDCLTDDEARQIARWALQLEVHFGAPQDIEWALDKNRQIIVLQSRPLRLISRGQGSHTDRPVDGFPVLVKGGETACPGMGSGTAVHLDENEDMNHFPEGAILVAKRPSPKFIRLMSKARAIVTDFGSTTGHMASLAREFRVPTLLNTKTATRDIHPGITVTVDAGSGFVYEGAVPFAEECGNKELRFDSWEQKPASPRFELLEKAVEIVTPLNLTDPGSHEFAADKCRTLHDIARYVHEKSYEEMFMMGSNVGDLRTSSYYLDIFLPIDLYLIDLGGGIADTHGSRKVKRSQVISVPFAALLKGMLHKKIPRFGAKPIDVSGFFSIMMRHAVNNPEGESSFRDPCYAIISDNYLNYAARVGYHFNVVDTYCGKTPNKNYISLTFRGGAADFIRRSRRTRAIAGILKEHGFSVHQSHDMVNARLSKASREETTGHLEMIGSLFQFFRQMDAAMVNENSVNLIKEAFLSGDYDLKKLKAQEQP